MSANLENSAVATGLEKVSFHSSPKERQCSNYHTIALISQASKVMLKIPQARPQQCVTWGLPDVQVGLEKAEEPEIKLPTSAGLLKNQQSSRKTSTSALLVIPKPLTVWITINCGKFFKRREYKTTLPASWETCMQVKKQVRTGHRTMACTNPHTARKCHNKENSTNYQNTERTPQTQQFKQDEETEEYPADKRTGAQNLKGSHVIMRGHLSLGSVLKCPCLSEFKQSKILA